MAGNEVHIYDVKVHCLFTFAWESHLWINAATFFYHFGSKIIMMEIIIAIVLYWVMIWIRVFVLVNNSLTCLYTVDTSRSEFKLKLLWMGARCTATR